MAEYQLTLSTEERDFLADLLEKMLKDTRVEEHRTRAPSYRELIVKQENLISAILAKLGISSRRDAAAAARKFGIDLGERRRARARPGGE